MQARAMRINQRKLARRGIIEDDKGISDCIPNLTIQRRTTKNPYRQLEMQPYGGAALELSACNWHSAQLRTYQQKVKMELMTRYVCNQLSAEKSRQHGQKFRRFARKRWRCHKSIVQWMKQWKHCSEMPDFGPSMYHIRRLRTECIGNLFM